MSNQNPSTPSRRRIAGERRGSTGPAAEPAQDTAPTEDTRPTRDTEPIQETGPTRDVHAEEVTGTEAPGPGKRIHGAVLIALGLLAAIAIGLSAYFWSESAEAQAAAQAESRAPAAAERAAQAVLSYNFETLEADKAKAVRLLTDGYRKDYTETFDTLVTKNAEQVKAEVEAQVVASAVTRASPNQADVLLFVNQTTTSTANNGEPKTALNRVTLDMREVDGTWLVDGITSY